VTLHELQGTPETAGLEACSVCSNWRVAVAATHRERKPYWFACHFDPHRPYQLVEAGLGRRRGAKYLGVLAQNLYDAFCDIVSNAEVFTEEQHSARDFLIHDVRTVPLR